MIASDEPAGGVIIGVEKADAIEGVTVFHARTTREAAGWSPAAAGDCSR